MTEKDIWRWLLPKLDNNILYNIYNNTHIDITCNGFRSNTMRDIKTHRKQLITNLFKKNHFPKLLLWARKTPPHKHKEIKLGDKEINELMQLVIDNDAVSIFSKLFYEGEISKAIQLFSFLTDQHADLLKIPDESISETTVSPTENDKEKDDENEEIEEPVDNQEIQEKNPVEEKQSKKEDKRLQKLEKKITNLTEEMDKRDKLHKQNLKEHKENLDQITNKLNEKNRLYGDLVKKMESLKNEHANKIESLEKEHAKEKEKWEKERSDYEEKIAKLQAEVNHLNAKQLDDEPTTIIVSKNEIHEKEELQQPTSKIRILVIGKPPNTAYFQMKDTEFIFVDGNEVHDYSFSLTYDAYWILLYELSVKDQVLLKNNLSYSQIESKVSICKNFIDVKKQMEHYKVNKVRAI